MSLSAILDDLEGKRSTEVADPPGNVSTEELEALANYATVSAEELARHEALESFNNLYSQVKDAPVVPRSLVLESMAMVNVESEVIKAKLTNNASIINREILETINNMARNTPWTTSRMDFTTWDLRAILTQLKSAFEDFNSRATSLTNYTTNVLGANMSVEENRSLYRVVSNRTPIDLLTSPFDMLYGIIDTELHYPPYENKLSKAIDELSVALLNSKLVDRLPSHTNQCSVLEIARTLSSLVDRATYLPSTIDKMCVDLDSPGFYDTMDFRSRLTEYINLALVMRSTCVARGVFDRLQEYFTVIAAK